MSDDFDEVVRFFGDDKDLRRTLRDLEKLVPKQLETIKKNAGKQLKDMLQIPKAKQSIEVFEQYANKAKQTRLELQKVVNALKEISNATKTVQKAQQSISAARGNIIPQFNTPAKQGGLSAPGIAQPLNKQIAADQAAAEKLEQASFERRLRNRLKYGQKQRQLEQKLALQSIRQAQRNADKRFREEQKLLQKRFKMRLSEIKAAAQRERATERRAATTANANAVKNRANASRSVRIGAGVAGAFGNFRLASGLFTASTALQGLDSDAFKGGPADIMKRAGGAALRATPAILGFTAALGGIAAVTKAIFEGAKLDKEIAELSTLYTKAALAGTDLQSALKETRVLAVELSSTFNIELTEAVEGFKTALSAGIDFPDLREFSMEAIELATALGTGFDESVDLLTTLRDSYGLSVGELNKVNNVLFRTIDEGKVTVSDLITNLGRVAPVASTAGVTIEDLFGTLTFATRQGLKSSRAITSVAKFIESVVNPSEKAKRAFNKLGLEFGQAAVTGENYVKFLEKLSAKTGGKLDVLSELFPETRALRVAASFANVIDLAKEQIEFVNKAGEETNEAGEAAARALDSVAVRFEQVQKAIMGQLAIEGGNILDFFFPRGDGDAMDRMKEFGGSIRELRDEVADFFGFLETLPNLNFTSLLFGDGLDNIGRIAENLTNTRIALAKQAVETGNLMEAYQRLADAGMDAADAVRFVTEIQQAADFTKFQSQVNGAADALRQGLVRALDSFTVQATQAQNKTQDLRDELQKLNDDIAKKGLTSSEKTQLGGVEQNIERNTLLRDIKIQGISQDISTQLGAITQELLNTLNEGVEGSNTSLATDVLRSYIDDLSEAVKNPELSDKLQNAFQNLMERFSNNGKAFTGSGKKEVQALQSVFDQLLSEVSFDPSMLDPEFFDPERLRVLTQAFPTEVADKINASAGAIMQFNEQLQKLGQQRQGILDIGTARGPEGLEAEKQRKKLLESLLKTKEKLADAQESENEFLGMSVEKLLKAKKITLDIAEAKAMQIQADVQAGETDGIAERIEGLSRLKETVQEVDEALEKQLQKEQELVKKVIELRQEEFQEARKFEEEKTALLKEEIDKRLAAVRTANDFQRGLNQDLFNLSLETVSPRKAKRLAKQRFEDLTEEARARLEEGDFEQARDLLDQARDTSQTEIGLTSDRGKLRAAKKNFGKLSEINREVRDVEISASLSNTEKLNAASFKFSNAVELLAKAMEGEGPLVSIDKSTNSVTVNWTSSSIDPDRVADEVIKVIDKQRDQGTKDSSRNPADAIKVPESPQKSVKPAGGAF